MPADIAAAPARVTAASWGILAAIGIARFGFGYQLQTVASLGPALTQAFHLSFAALGSLVGAYMLPGIAAALACGFLAQRFGDRALLGLGMALMAAGSAGAGLAAGPFGIALARVIAGSGAVAMTVLQGKVLADRFQGRQFLPALGLSVGAFPVGLGVAQLTQVPLAEAFGWRAAFLAGAVPAAAAAGLLAASWRGGAATGRRRPGWPSGAECALVLLAGLMWTFYNGAFTAFLTYTPSLLAARGAPLWRTDLVMNLATWGNLPAILFGGVAAARFGAGRVMWLGTLATAVPLAAIGLGAPPVAWGALFGTVGALHAGVIVGVGTLSASPQHRAVGMALFYTAYYIGGTVFPALCGRAADLMGDPGGALLCGAVLGLLTLPCWSLHQRRMARAPGAG